MALVQRWPLLPRSLLAAVCAGPDEFLCAVLPFFYPQLQLRPNHSSSEDIRLFSMISNQSTLQESRKSALRMVYFNIGLPGGASCHFCPGAYVLCSSAENIHANWKINQCLNYSLKVGY